MLDKLTLYEIFEKIRSFIQSDILFKVLFTIANFEYTLEDPKAVSINHSIYSIYKNKVYRREYILSL